MSSSKNQIIHLIVKTVTLMTIITTNADTINVDDRDFRFISFKGKLSSTNYNTKRYNFFCNNLIEQSCKKNCFTNFIGVSLTRCNFFLQKTGSNTRNL